MGAKSQGFIRPHATKFYIKFKSGDAHYVVNICATVINKKGGKNMERKIGIRLSDIDKGELNKWGVPCGTFGWKFNGYNAEFGESTWRKED